MPSFPNYEFAELWQKVTRRYYVETGKSVNMVRQFAVLITHMRSFPEVNQELPLSGNGDLEGLAIYKAVNEIGKSIDIKLGSKYYKALKCYADGTPHTPIEEYYSYLRRFYTKNGTLGEVDLSLQDLYLEPRFIKKATYSNEDQSLVELIIRWLEGQYDGKDNKISESYNNIYFIFGDPGQGKTSFCYRLLYQITASIKRPIYFCRLRYVDNINNFNGNIFDLIFNHLNESGYNREDGSTGKIPISSDYSESILVLDGLDELEKLYNLEKDTLSIQISNLTNKINRPYKTIITSRKEIDINRLKDYKIPYFILHELEEFEQLEWVNRYNNKAIHKYNISSEEIRELNSSYVTGPLIRQPILLHIIAQLDIHPDNGQNASKIYNELFSRLINRYWDNYKGNSSHNILDKTLNTKDKLRSVLQLIGLEMFKRNTTYLNQNEIPPEVVEELNLDEGLKLQALKTLLLAFYFNQGILEKEGEKLFIIEFLHKTFGEYLAAEAICHHIKVIYANPTLNMQLINLSLNNLFYNNVQINHVIINYIIQIIQTSNSQSDHYLNPHDVLFNNMYNSLEFLINHWFIANVSEKLYIKNINVIYGFMSIFFRLGFAFTKGKQKNKSIVVLNYLSNIFRLVSHSLKNINLSYCKLDEVDLRNAHMENSILSNVSLNFAKLSQSNFSNSDLSNAKLFRSNLSYSDFNKSILKNVQLSYAIARNCNFENSNFSGSIIKDADFSFCNLIYSNLSNCDLSKINLEGSNLYFSNLENSKIIDGKLYKTNLNKTNLRGVDFSSSSLKEAILTNANLTNAVLNKTLLIGTKIDNVDLRSISIEGAFLDMTNFSNSNLSSLDFSGTYSQSINFEKSILIKTIFSNAVLKRVNFSEADLSDSFLDNAILDNAILQKCKLNRANLIRASLNYSNLKGAQIQGAKLNNASIIKSDLGDADLWNSTLIGANLTETNLGNAKLAFANLSNATLYNTIFYNTNLRNVVFEGAVGLNYHQLLTSNSLVGCVGLPDELENNLRLNCPQLFIDDNI